MSQYTQEIRSIFKTVKSPYPKFVVDVVEFTDYLGLRVYRNNIAEFSDPQKVALSEYLYQLRDAIRSTGAKCHIEGAEGDPPRSRT